jgi:glutamyl-tRNA synthetase
MAAAAGAPAPDLRLPLHLQNRLASALQQRSLRYTTRFAPSPTGPLHRGNLRTALLSWLKAQLSDGQWLLRIDDLDGPRNRAGAEASILEDLHWLGLDWDGPVVRQSDHRGVYATVLSALRKAGCLYPCRCSRRLLADVSAPHGALAVYPGYCRDQAPLWGPQAGRLPSWRLRLEPAAVGDVVLWRADGVVAYHLATAVDELLMGISEVVRGDDLWPSTGAQVAVMAALGAPPPSYAHVPLWRDGRGERLSKRDGAEGLAGLRSRGMDAPAVIGCLASSLELVPPGSRLSARELAASLSPEVLEACLHPERGQGKKV